MTSFGLGVFLMEISGRCHGQVPNQLSNLPLLLLLLVVVVPIP